MTRPLPNVSDGDALAHLLLREPLLLGHEFAFPLPHERDGSAEPEQPQTQVVPDEIADRDAVRWLRRLG
jgi:hypothetical protein